MNIEEKVGQLIKGLKKHCESIKPLNLAGIATSNTLTLEDKIQTFSYHCVSGPATYYQFFGKYYWTIMQMSLGEQTENIIAIRLYHKERDHGLTSGQQLKEVCVIVPNLPFRTGMYARIEVETDLLDPLSADLRLIAEFTEKVSALLSP